MMSQEFRELIDMRSLCVSGRVKWLIVEWNPQGLIERGYLNLYGPVLRSTIEDIRAKLEQGSAPSSDLQRKIDRVEDLLGSRDVVLSGGAVVGIGCLHT